MNLTVSEPVFVLIAVAVLMPSCAAGQNMIRMKIANHSEQRGVPRGMEPTDSEVIIYLMGDRIRSEVPSHGRIPAVITIQRCDMEVIYSIRPDTHEYTEARFVSPKTDERDADKATSKGKPNLVFETHAVDTGQTKPAFGHAARHYIITTKSTPAPELKEQASEIVEDWWYLDTPEITSCGPTTHRTHGLIGAQFSTKIKGSSANDTPPVERRPEFRYSGPDPHGQFLSKKSTSKWTYVYATGEKQTRELVSSSEVVALEEVADKPEVFEVPAGYKKVERFTR